MIDNYVMSNKEIKMFGIKDNMNEIRKEIILDWISGERLREIVKNIQDTKTIAFLVELADEAFIEGYNKGVSAGYKKALN